MHAVTKTEEMDNSFSLLATPIANSNNLDRTFLRIIEEIKAQYLKFNKTDRLRIEKWVEKLLTVVLLDGNTDRVIVWRKDRNLYAKVLLDCIIKRALCEPFTRFPPEGQLQSFPLHLRKGRDDRDLAGIHESSFWREMYDRVNVPIGNNSSGSSNSSRNGEVASSSGSGNNRNVVGSHYTDADNISQIDQYISNSPFESPDRYGTANSTPTKPGAIKQYNQIYEQKRLTFKGTSSMSKVQPLDDNSSNSSNNNNLRAIVNEQALRIQALEEQLVQEKTHNELQIRLIKNAYEAEMLSLTNGQKTSFHHHPYQPYVHASTSTIASTGSSTVASSSSSNASSSFHDYKTASFYPSPPRVNMNSKVDGSTDQFLDYIDKFQREIKQLSGSV